ncbi:MAG: branched-chain amino acid ABC transporter permease [Chloroflexi bacterium]|nr:branched-chain amino acid ABC transporter permease [Chloroflexota bacterium]
MIIGRYYIDHKSVVPKIVIGALIALVAIFPLFTINMVTLSIIILSGIWAIAVMGFLLILRTGQFSLGQAAFMAIGGYVSAILTVKMGMSYWPSFVAAGIISGVIAFIIGIVVLRAGGIYFSIITIAFGEIVRIVAMNWESVTQGASGILTHAPESLTVGNLEINFAASVVPYYYFMLLLVTVSALFYWQIDRTRIGGTFRSVAANPVLAEHLGINLMKHRLIAFTIAGLFTGLAGAYYVTFLSVMNPLIFDLWKSVQIMMMTIVGGMGSIVGGPIIGATLLYTLGIYLSRLPIPNIQYLVFGGVVVLLLLVLPKGTGLVDQWGKLWRWVFGEPEDFQMPGEEGMDEE